MSKFDIINKSEETAKREKFKLANKRTIVRAEAGRKSNLLGGCVVASNGKNYIVKIEGTDNFLECTRAGRISSENPNSQLIAVGDDVAVEIADSEAELASIVQVKKRRTELARMSIYGKKEDIIAANADKLLIVAAACDPFYNRRMIDRMLIAADMGGINAAICINKCEMMPQDFLDEDLQIYRKLNIPLYFTSANKQIGLEGIREYIATGTTIFSGQSGVGKSSLLNLLCGENIQRTLEISEKSGKGRHTTSAATLFEIDENSRIIDTPGLREFGLIGIKKEELPLMFDDFEPFFEKCRFMPCTHTHEPHCAVKAAVENGEIDPERYQSYLNIFESLE